MGDTCKMVTNKASGFYRYEPRWPRLEYQPPEYFEKQAIPFADVWGHEVPSTRWDLAEAFSLTPFGRVEIFDQLESLFPRDYPILNYLSQGASIQVISKL